jgi:hypothetical protein
MAHQPESRAGGGQEPEAGSGKEKGMSRLRLIRYAGIAAVVAVLAAFVLPAWASPSKAPTGTQAIAAGNVLTSQLAQMRLATAKYSTNLDAAKADGYEIITQMIPNMGYHFLNKSISGFDIKRPQILVYEHRGNSWQLGALEWVFTEMPASPPLQDATFGFFPAACHYKDGTFIPQDDSSKCPPKNPDTGSPFNFWHPDLFTLHVWVWYPNTAGLYAGTNPLIRPFNEG